MPTGLLLCDFSEFLSKVLTAVTFLSFKYKVMDVFLSYSTRELQYACHNCDDCSFPSRYPQQKNEE